MAGKDYYQILDVEKNASKEEIKKAYRRLAKQHHPDQHQGNKQAEARFKEITEANSVISDERKRQQYDLMGDASARYGEGEAFWENIRSGMGGRTGAERPGRGRAEQAGRFGYEDLGDMGDLFSRLFGGGSPFTGGGPHAHDQTARGEDLVTRLEIPFDLSVKGGRIKVTVPVEETCSTCSGSGAKPGSSRQCQACRGSGMVQTAMGGFAVSRPCPQCLGRGHIITAPCADCGGRGRTARRRSLMAKIPAGVREGQTIRLAGQGHQGSAGGPSGDLLIEIAVAPHPEFRRDGNDVYSEVTISMTQAALGTEAPIQTVQGAVKLKIHAGTNSGAKLRLKGKGVVSADGVAGDHYVIVKVLTPQCLTKQQRKLLEQFDK